MSAVTSASRNRLCASSSRLEWSSRSASTGMPARRSPDASQTPPVRQGPQTAIRQVPGVIHRPFRHPPGRAPHIPYQDRRRPLAPRRGNRHLTGHLARRQASADRPFGNYARAWLRDHPKMGPRYRETCERNLRLHLAPLEDTPLRALTPAVVREWYASALRGKGGRTSIQQSYRFLRAVMSTAVRDGAITKNPCQIPGAGSDRAKERPIATPAQVAALIQAITPEVPGCHLARLPGAGYVAAKCSPCTARTST